MLALTDSFWGWPEVFPWRIPKAGEVTKMLLHAVNSKVRGSCSILSRSWPTFLPRWSNKEAHDWELIGNCTHLIDHGQGRGAYTMDTSYLPEESTRTTVDSTRERGPLKIRIRKHGEEFQNGQCHWGSSHSLAREELLPKN